MRPEKQLLLDEVQSQIDQYGSFLIMKYSGFGANQVTEFRDQVHKMGGDVEMVRKRILVKAAQASGLDISLEDLDGHIALVYAGADPIEMTKFVFKISKDTKKAVEVIGGRIDDRLYFAEDMQKLSKLPSKQEMQAQLLALLEAPLSQTVSVMEAILTSVMHCLENKQKEEK